MLNTQEGIALQWLVNAYNYYLTLPVIHPTHQREFTTYMSELQRLIMCRPESRELNSAPDVINDVDGTKWHKQLNSQVDTYINGEKVCL